uniref:Polyprotein n=1 Tax=Picornavirales sp. TaxID=1955153 RepID=A0A6M9Z7N0_9VIRU|nr:MAG: polyprotein [Picornavirales sp.]
MQVELKSPITVRAGTCLIRKGDGTIPLEGCLWDCKNKELMFQYIEAVRTVAPDVVASATSCRTHDIAKRHFPQEWIDKLTIMRDPIQTEIGAKLRQREIKIVNAAVTEIEKRYIVRQGNLFGVLPKERTLFEKIIDGLYAVLASLKILILGIFTIMAGFALVRSFTGGSDDKAEPNVHASGDFHKMKHSRSMRVKARNLFGSDEAQGAIESAMIDSEEDYARVTAIRGDKDRQIIDKILRNAVYVVGMVPQPDGRLKTYKVRCLGLYERKVLFIRHYYEHFVANGVTRVGIVSRYGNSDIRYNLDELNFEWTDGGYGVLSLPSSYPYSFLNIVKRFMPSEDKNFQYPARGLLVEFTFDDVYCWSVPLKLESSIDVKGVNAQQPWVIAKGFSYPWGGPGKCGSLLFAPTLGTPLIGVHTAGIGESKGYSELLLKETFIDAVEPNVVDYIVPQMEIREDTAVLGGEYQIVGTLDSDMMLHTPKETKIVESEIHGVFPVKTEPAPLSSSDPRLPKGCDPLYEGTSKRCDKIREFIAADVQYAATDLRSVILQNAEPLRQVKPLSVLEAINGFPGLHGYEKIEMKTSEGYPWVKLRPKGYTDKSWMFQFDQDENGQKRVSGVCVDLHKTLETKSRMRQLGLVPASYFSACLKDARILKEKVSTPGKTRVFEISPVDLTIAQRQLMLDFTAAYQNSRTKCENTIGINVNGPEWTDLATQLTSFSPYILTGDFSGFGPRLSLQCLEIVFDIISQWYIMHDSSRTEEQVYVEMESLKHEIVHGLHVFKNLVFRPTSGMPSGNAATVHLNSLVNSLYIRVAYLSIMREARADLADLYYFHKLVRFFHNGDDIIMSVHPDIIDVFNNESLQKFFAQYDIKYTDATKSGEIRKYCTIEEATYLKSHFKRHPFRQGQWLAALAAESVGDCANWVWKSPNLRESSLLNSEQACRLAYGHGEIYYRFVCQTIRNAWEKHSVNFRAPLWRSLDAAVWDRVDGPLFTY